MNCLRAVGDALNFVPSLFVSGFASILKPR